MELTIALWLDKIRLDHNRHDGSGEVSGSGDSISYSYRCNSFGVNMFEPRVLTMVLKKRCPVLLLEMFEI